MNSAVVVNGDGHVMMMIIQVWQVDCMSVVGGVGCLFAELVHGCEWPQQCMHN